MPTCKIMRCTVTFFNSWLPSVGLEIHAQIISNTKIFSQGPARLRDSLSNSTLALFDIAIPGTLPVINEACVRAGVRTAVALGAKINTCSFFDRKHYFYPDLPGGYQISQNRVPLATGGSLTIPVLNTSIKLKQIQLEQDSGKIIFGEEDEGGGGGRETLVNYNRAGVGLMEIITEPVMTSGDQAASFVRELRLLLRKIGACDGNMQDGSLRVDANVSVRPSQKDQLGVKTEVKNINGLKYLSKAIDYEISRHIKLLQDGGTVLEETRSYDEKRNVTIATRGKSQYEDYRFMAEHDLPPLVLYTDATHPATNKTTHPNYHTVNATPSTPPTYSNDINIDDIARSMPELPAEQRRRLMQSCDMSIEQIQVLEREDWAIDYFEEVIRIIPTVPVKLIYSWITSELYRFAITSVSPDQLSSLLVLLNNGTITGPIAKRILRLMAKGSPKLAQSILEELNVQQLDETKLSDVCVSILNKHPQLVKEYQSNSSKGKKVLGFLIGEVMTATNRENDPVTVRALLIKELNKQQ